MVYITLGICGFLIIHAFDLISLKKLPLLKPVTWALGCVLLVYAVFKLITTGGRFVLMPWLSAVGWTLLAVSVAMLVWSLFISLPFRKTYVRAGIGDKLITTGFYALVRHPGVHWFSLGMVALVIVTKSMQMLAAAPLFIVLDVILVVIQDKLVFTRMFPDYPRYQQETPMLIPSRRSLKAFISSFGRNLQTDRAWR